MKELIANWSTRLARDLGTTLGHTMKQRKWNDTKTDIWKIPDWQTYWYHFHKLAALLLNTDNMYGNQNLKFSQMFETEYLNFRRTSCSYQQEGENKNASIVSLIKRLDTVMFEALKIRSDSLLVVNWGILKGQGEFVPTLKEGGAKFNTVTYDQFLE